MKKIIVLLMFVAAVSAVVTAQQAYRPLSEFAGDTLVMINFIRDNKPIP